MPVSGWIQMIRLRAGGLLEAELLPRFQALAPREQKMVLTAAIVVPLMILIFGLLLPLHDARKLQEDHVSLLAGQVDEAKQLAAMITAGVGKRFSGSLLSTVDRSAAERGVKKFMTHIRPQPEVDGSQQITLQLKDAPYQSVISFLLNLEQQGMAVEAVQIRAAKVSGTVHLQATIKG